MEVENTLFITISDVWYLPGFPDFAQHAYDRRPVIIFQKAIKRSTGYEYSWKRRTSQPHPYQVLALRFSLYANAQNTSINSTFYGGGVAELLGSLTMLMNTAGIKTGWRVLQGSPDFFSVTKKMHNAMQGGEINLTERKQGIYETAILENALRNHIDHDIVIVHDPQPLPMIHHYRKRGPWIWRCRSKPISN